VRERKVSFLNEALLVRQHQAVLEKGGFPRQHGLEDGQ
jgi:hypothetical protein